MARQSFSDAILEEPDRFLDKIFGKNPNIKDFGDFQDAFLEYMGEDSTKEANSKIDSQDIINLFQTSECKSKIRENVSDQEYDNLFGDGMIVKRETTSRKNQVVTIQAEKVKVSSYTTKTGKKIKPTKAYAKTKNKIWGSAELKFIQVRKQKGIKPAKITKDFNAHFSKNPRTYDSVRSKVYRV